MTAQTCTFRYQVGWLEFLASLKRRHEVGAGWRPVEQVAPVS